jgi:hypothetical protein
MPSGLSTNERGVGLLMALLVLVAIGAIAVGLISSVATDRRLASYNADRAKAMQYAEAGVYEAYERIRVGDVPLKSNPDPKTVAQVFRATTGSMPAVGPDTIAMATGQPAGEWLPYSSPTKGPDVLTVRYMTNAARTGVYRYDVTQTPPIQGKTGDPVFIINSPARVGLARAEIEATVAMQNLKVNLLGAYASSDKLDFNGSIFVYGQDYTAETPVGTGNTGTGDNTYWSTNPAIAAAWSMKDIKIGGATKLSGNPNEAEFKTGFYDGPWNVFNMNQDEFWNWVGSPNKQLKADLPRGIIYLGDPKDKPQKGHKKFDIKGGYGDGLLYVNGRLKVNGDFTFRGLIYVEDDLEISGDAWILGGVVVADNAHTHGQKKTPMTVIASKETIQQYVGQYGNPFVTLGWKEK